MLIIFDIDGTLCDTHDVDARCHVAAVEAVTGRSLATVDWSLYPEATSSAIVHDLLKNMGIPDVVETEQRIYDDFVARLNVEARQRPEQFRPLDGGLELFEQLRQREEHSIAIATGDWQESAKLKLRLSGYKADDVPFASSSDTRRRVDIITLAAQRAGYALVDSVYVGDGVWDVKAAREINIRFVGVGRRHELLRQQGAAHVMPTFADRALFFSALRNIQ